MTAAPVVRERPDSGSPVHVGAMIGLVSLPRPIDAEVFEAGKERLKVVSQMAVGFDNINRTDANRYKVPFTNTADVLTEATAEFAFFMMGAVARKLWPSETLVRENRWGAWHPFLPFLGDEVTGKTVAIIGTGRIGLAMIKKCTGMDMNILCYDPAYENHEYVAGIQSVMDLRHERGIQKHRTQIKYVNFEAALAEADFVSVHVPLLREGESSTPTFHLFKEKTLRMMKPSAYLINTSRGPVVNEAALAKALKKRWIAGGLSAFGGVLLAGYASKAAQAMGDPYLLPAIAAVVLGGTSILGGRGNYLGTVAGVVLITLLQSILSVMQIEEFGRHVIYGVVIIAMLLLYGRGQPYSN